MSPEEIAREEAEMAEQRKRLAAVSKPQGGVLKSRVDEGVKPKRFVYPGRIVHETDKATCFGLRDGRYLFNCWLPHHLAAYVTSVAGELKFTDWAEEEHKARIKEAFDTAIRNGREAKEDERRLG
jgi:hypothetical protein